jgi:NitT/TauT family transport system permease protein
LEEKFLMKISFTKKHYISLASLAFMLVFWKALSLYLGSDIILPPPEKILFTSLRLFGDDRFLAIVGTTILRGALGFLISLVLGLGLGILAGINPNFNTFMRPIIISIRTIPIIALILLALIWLGSDFVPIFIALLTMFPFIYTNVTDGIKSVDPDLVEMATFYRVGKSRIIKELYIPAILPFIFSGASSAIGIGWRAIITGEVLSQPEYGIGTLMQAAQTFLNVDAVIAWTLVAVIISYGFEKIIRWIERLLIVWRT